MKLKIGDEDLARLICDAFEESAPNEYLAYDELGDLKDVIFDGSWSVVDVAKKLKELLEKF